MKKTLLATCIGLSMPMLAQADTIGFRVGVNNWQQNYDGEVLSSTAAIDKVDIEQDLGLDDETNNGFYLALEHPVPVLPNVMLERTELDIKKTNQLTRSFTFDNVTYNINEDVTTTSDLSHTDATLYYEILDNWISVDFGLTIRQFDEGVTLESGTNRAELEIDGAVPMLYLAAKGELPLTGLYIGATVKGIGYADGTLTDLKANLGYETDFGLGVELGLRSFEIDYDDDEEEANLTIDGAYAGVFYHF